MVGDTEPRDSEPCLLRDTELRGRNAVGEDGFARSARDLREERAHAVKEKRWTGTRSPWTCLSRVGSAWVSIWWRYFRRDLAFNSSTLRSEVRRVQSKMLRARTPPLARASAEAETKRHSGSRAL